MRIKEQAKEEGEQAKYVKSPGDTLLLLASDILDLVTLKIWMEGNVFLGLGKQGMMITCRERVVTVQSRHFAGRMQICERFERHDAS